MGATPGLFCLKNFFRSERCYWIDFLLRHILQIKDSKDSLYPTTSCNNLKLLKGCQYYAKELCQAETNSSFSCRRD